MKRKFFSCLMFSALLGAGMLSVTSCADYDEDMKTLTEIVDNNTTATNALQAQLNGMQTQIKSLQDALNAMKSCQCGDVDAKIADQINKALAGLNYTTPEQVADAITKALAGINTGLTAEEVQALVETYHNAHPDCNCGDIQALIEKYLKENPGLTASDVEAIVKGYHDAHPQSTLSENDVKSIVETYINQLQHFTKEQIEAMINTAITQALAGYVQKADMANYYTKNQVEDLVKAAIAEALKGITHPESGLNEAEVNALINAALSKIVHPETGLTEAQVNALITEALKSVKPGLTVEEVQALIDAAKCNCPALTTDDVTTIATTVIEKYMQEHPYTLDTAAVENICNNVINNSQVINNIQSAINTLQTTVDRVVEDLQNLKNNVYTKTEIENLINALIAQAIKNCDCDNTALTTEQQAIVSNLISEAINNYNAAHPDCNCQYDAAAFQSLVDAVAANTTAIQSIQGDYVTSSQLLQAIEDVKNLIPTIPDLSVYVTVATYNADMVLVNLSIAAADTKAQEALDKANEALSIANDALGNANNALNNANNALDNANTALTTANANKVLIDNLTTTVSELNALYLSLSQKLDNTARKADTALTHALSNYFEIETLKSLYAELSSKIALIESQGYDDTAILNRLQTLEEQLGSLESQIASLATKEELEAQLQTVQGLVSDAQAAAQNYADNAAATAASAVLADAKSYTDTKMGELNTKIGELITAYKDADLALQGQIGTINDRLNDIDATLTDLQKQIDKVTGRLDKVENALAHLITGIELQGSTNPAFGYFSLPVGVTSNVLLAYYGENDHDTYFPAIDDYDLVYADPENWITEADYERIGFDPTTWNDGAPLSGGSTILNEEGNAGKLYLTLNPSNVDFTGTQLKLVNSLGEESPVSLAALKQSTDKLAFGQTRATRTYFYEALATVDADHVGSATYNITDQLTQVLKDVQKNGISSNISDLGQAVYSQLNGNLDAYAVQATWTDDLGEHSITSRYNIAATAFKPLSYNTLAGINFKLPTITPFSERDIDLKKYIDLSKFNKEFKKEDLGINIKFNFSDIYVDASGNVVTDVHLIEKNEDYEESTYPVVLISASGVYTDPVTGETKTFTGYDRETAEWVAQIITNRADTWSAQLTKDFADNVEKLIDKVNDITTPGGRLESTLNDLVDKVQNKLNSALKAGDKFINGFNKLIAQVNDNLFGNGNPNLRLQGQVFYSDADGLLHPMSTAKGMPTVFTGDGEAIELNLSSYTGEILAPAYKKFVAVTNVYKGGQNADTDPGLMKALKTANAVEGFNEVMTGDHYAVAFHPTVKGATYEIVYSSLDFHGFISQRKYYVTVK